MNLLKEISAFDGRQVEITQQAKSTSLLSKPLEGEKKIF